MTDNNEDVTFSAFERIHRMKKGSALFRVSKSLVKEVWRKQRKGGLFKSQSLWEVVWLPVFYTWTVVGEVTWNWALMLGGFFFLCTGSRGLLVRSCSVSLTMNFRDREFSKFCRVNTVKFIWCLHSIIEKELFYFLALTVLSPSLAPEIGCFTRVYLRHGLFLFGALVFPVEERRCRVSLKDWSIKVAGRQNK